MALLTVEQLEAESGVSRLVKCNSEPISYQLLQESHFISPLRNRFVFMRLLFDLFVLIGAEVVPTTENPRAARNLRASASRARFSLSGSFSVSFIDLTP